MRKRARFCSFRMVLSNLDRWGMNHGEFFESEQRKLDGSKIFFQWKLEGRNDSPLKIFSMRK